MTKRVSAIRRFSIGLAVCSILFGFTWQKHGFCLGDTILTSLGLPAWSNGISGTHYSAILALTGLLIAFLLFTASAGKKAQLPAKTIDVSTESSYFGVKNGCSFFAYVQKGATSHLS